MNMNFYLNIGYGSTDNYKRLSAGMERLLLKRKTSLLCDTYLNSASPFYEKTGSSGVLEFSGIYADGDAACNYLYSLAKDAESKSELVFYSDADSSGEGFSAGKCVVTVCIDSLGVVEESKKVFSGRMLFGGVTEIVFVPPTD